MLIFGGVAITFIVIRANRKKEAANNDVVAAEEVRLRGKLGLKDSAELRYGLERVGNKLQHQVMRYLREHAADPQVEKVVREMLGLE